MRTYKVGVNDWVSFDTRRSGLTWYSGGCHFVFGAQMHGERLTGVGVWARRWKHLGGNMTIGSSTFGKRAD